jgi:hypothetical protein
MGFEFARLVRAELSLEIEVKSLGASAVLHDPSSLFRSISLA